MSTSTSISPQQQGAQHVEIDMAGNCELVYSDPEKLDGMKEAQGDYSGAVRKTDAAEIALVKKLDRRMLPLLGAMYFLNYVRFVP